LVKAKDESLPDDAFVCFRKKQDEFFVFTITRHSFIKHWDEEKKQMVPDKTPIPGFGYTQTYKDGVLASTRMPVFNFSGQWEPESGYFGDSGRCRSVFRGMLITGSGMMAIMIPG